ncbi:hypothetical protein OF117_11830 [Geodermatophilus sp. YIM 151500]|uniref:hypothetical protein n=1 Tax=Geodermatophilus sp. YIM 151500 TaxID=2984531 RepID=UPI0021E38EA3|nr:hypothetical protein [Geodermatophilus sp. YIM 151500]MCV2490051.1 hypothetical protein [Geodermatophilus sp. YIM 151500]
MTWLPSHAARLVAGQHRLGAIGGLLGAGAQHRRHGVRRGQDRGDGERGAEVGVDQPVDVRVAEDQQRLLVLADQRLDRLGERAVHDAQQRQPDQPRDERAALQPHRQPQRGEQRPPGGRRSRPRLGQPRAEVAPVQQREADDHERGGDREAEHQGQPPVARVRVRGLRPADRRGPHHPVALDVADGAQHERDGEQAADDAVGGPGVAGDLDGDRGDAGEHQPAGADRGAQQERAARRKPGRRDRRADRHRQQDAGQRRQQDGGQQGGVPVDPGRPDQLGAPGLLVGAGVARDGEHRHERGDEHDGARDLEGDRAGHGVQPHRRAGQRDRRRVGPDRGAVGGQVGGAVVQRLAGHRLQDHHEGADGDPDG